MLRPDEICVLAGVNCPVPVSLRIIRISRDRVTHAVTLEWVPSVDSCIIERSANLSTWETLAAGVTGTVWTGTIPGAPRETYLRVRGTVFQP